MNQSNTVDDYINSAGFWQEELVRLREIMQSTKLDETVKWGMPCYTHDGKLIVGIFACKAYVGLWFYQGALLKDETQVLMNAQDGKTKAMRQWRFGSIKEIKPRTIKAYVREAVNNEQQGRSIKPDRSRPVVVPPELKKALAKDRETAAAFQEMPKGKQRDYAEHIANAKQDATKERRLQKILPMIREGVGLHDKYKN